jgi:hypothetical protein
MTTFIDGDAQALHRVRQAGQGLGDAILGEHLRRVEIGAELEGDGEG